MSPTYSCPSGPSEIASTSRGVPIPDRVIRATVFPVAESTAYTYGPSSLSLCVQYTPGWIRLAASPLDSLIRGSEIVNPVRAGLPAATATGPGSARRTASTPTTPVTDAAEEDDDDSRRIPPACQGAPRIPTSCPASQGLRPRDPR